MSDYRKHGGDLYEVMVTYDHTATAWAVELTTPTAANSLIAHIPDEDPTLEPTINSYATDKIPYDIMVWFMATVTEEVARVRRDANA